MTYQLGAMKNELDLGFRFLYERAFEQLINGTTRNSSSGNMRDDEIRTGYARSAFIQNRLFLTNKLIVSPGVRFESFLYDRNIMRDSLAPQSETRASLQAANFFKSYQGWVSAINLVKDLPFCRRSPWICATAYQGRCYSAGQALELDAELSWNYEVGSRYTPSAGILFELTGFLLDFSNQIIPVSLSSGGAAPVL